MKVRQLNAALLAKGVVFMVPITETLAAASSAARADGRSITGGDGSYSPSDPADRVYEYNGAPASQGSVTGGSAGLGGRSSTFVESGPCINASTYHTYHTYQVSAAHVRARKAKITVFGAVCCISAIVFSGSPGTADDKRQTTTLSLTSEQATHFDQALAAIAVSSHRAIVAEGRPLRDTLDATQAKPLLEASRFPQGLEAFCRAYDYEIISEDEGGAAFPDVLALRKKYNHSNDLPGVTIEECLAALKDAQRFSRNVTGNIPLADRRKIIQNSLDSIPQNRRQQLSNEGIPIRELSPYQRDRFRRIALYFYLSKQLSPLNQCQRMLSGYHDYALTRIVKNKKHVVVVTGKDNLGMWQHPLLGIAPGSFPVKTPFDALSKPEAILAEHTTPVLALKGVAQKTGLDIQVHESLTEKPITIAGSRYAAPSHLVKATAAVYGLHATSSVPDKWEVKRPGLPREHDFTTMYTTIKRILPLPLVRAAEPVDQVKRLKAADTARRDWLSRSSAGDKGLDAKRVHLLTGEMRNLVLALEHRPGDIANECQNRLEVLYEARAKGKAGYTVSLDELGPEAKRCFAVLMIAGLMDSLQKVSEPGGPAYLQRFDQGVATGGEEGKFIWVGLGIAQPGQKVAPMVRMDVIK